MTNREYDMDKLLRNIDRSGGWFVTAANLVDAAELVRRGWAMPKDGYEGPSLSLTEDGRTELARRLA